MQYFRIDFDASGGLLNPRQRDMFFDFLQRSARRACWWPPTAG